MERLPAGRASALDPSDPTHRAAISAALAAAGRSRERYPALHAGLADGGCADIGDDLALVDMGRDPAGRATALTWYAAGPEALYAGGSVFAFAADGGVLAAGHNSNVGDGFVQVSTDTPTALPAGQELKVLAVHHSVSRTGQASFTALTSAWASPSADARIKVEMPTQSPKKLPNVVIALGRTTIGPDADYTYLLGSTTDSPFLILPFVGWASLPYDIDGRQGAYITGATLTSVVYFVAGGIAKIVKLNDTYTPKDKLYKAVTTDRVDPTRINWSYPYDSLQPARTFSLVYDPQSLVNEQNSYFFYSFQIPVRNAPTPTYTFAVCSADTPNEPSYQCFIIPNITFRWHCLAGDTRIGLADGSEAPIDAVSNAHRVRTGMPGMADLAVEATSQGSHQAAGGAAGWAAVYRLVTDQGHELVGSGQHVLKTPGGLTPLGNLAPGDEVTAESGVVRVASCEAIDWDGTLYNLKLGDESDRAAGLTDDMACTYIANGLMVGDHLAARAEQRRLARSVDYMSARLPAGLATDYASAVADIRY
ncbi:MAG TPA: hypothetical protein VGG25_10835 [Streptosporangiaceae bacterium]